MCAAALVVLAPLLRYLCTPWFDNSFSIYMLTPFRMDLLAVGALLAILWRHRRPSVERWGVLGPALTAAALATLLILSRHPGFTTYANTRLGNVWIYELTLLASAGLILWALSGRFVTLLNLAPVQYLGRISYSFYLIHTTALFILQPHIRRFWLLGILTLVLSLAYAALSWRFLERPLLYAGATKKQRTEASIDERAITNPTS